MNTTDSHPDSKKHNLSFGKRVIDLYVDGFRNMTVGKTLWIIIIVKIIVLIILMKILFFPDVLNRDYNTDSERASAVRHSLSTPR